LQGNRRVFFQTAEFPCKGPGFLAGQSFIAKPVEALGEDDVGCWAACALKAVGPQGAVAVRKLLETADKARIRLRLTARLALSPPGPYEELLATLRDVEPAARCWAVDTLTRLAEAAPDRAGAVGPPLEFVARQDKQPEVRSRAAFALARLTLRGDGAVTALTRVLIDRAARPAERVRAARLLGGFAQQAGSAEPALVAAVADPDPVLRKAAAVSLGKVSAGNEAAVQALLDAAVSAAARGDAELYEAARKASDALLARMRDARRRERLQTLARQTAARAAAYRARADKARAWAEANRARVERELAAGQQWLSDAEARTDRLVAGFCYDRQAHLDDAAYYAAAAETCQGSAAYWSGLGNSAWAEAYSRMAQEYDRWATYHRDTAGRLPS
jgi:hypothetical protein